MSLNKDQQKLYDYICDETIGKIILNASAGTGKTFFVKYLIHNAGMNIQILAPTHKAKSLFSKEKLPCQTIHKFLNSEKDVDEDTGEIIFNFKNFKNLDEIDLLIVDECSMISNKMFEVFETLSCDILYVGDDHQLPPIGEDLSQVFEQEYKVFNFTENMRIEVNPDSLSAIYLKNFRKSVDDLTKRIRIEHRVDIDMMIDYFKEKKDVVCLAWTNKQVSILNNIIRSKLFNKTANNLDKYYVGEELIYSGYRVTDETLTITPKITYLIYHSSDKIIIDHLKDMKQFIKYRRCEHQENDKKLKTCKKCNIKGHKVIGYNINFVSITDHNGIQWNMPKEEIDISNMKLILSDFKRHCIKMRNKYTWLQYHDFKNKYFPDLFYRYSMTIHKSQGSQWEYVYIDIDNIRKCRDSGLSSKLSYTAVSRFKKNVFFL